MDDKIHKIKVVLTGDTLVGKTSLANRYVKNSFAENLPPTVLNNNLQRKISVLDKEYLIDIWDTAGQEQYQTLAPLSYREANAILMLFSCTDETTLENLERWKENINEHVNLKTISLLVVGTKSDMLDEKDQNTIMNKAKSKFSEIEESNFFITSSKNGKGIPELFDYIILSVENNSNNIITGGSLSLDDDPEKKSCC